MSALNAFGWILGTIFLAISVWAVLGLKENKRLIILVFLFGITGMFFQIGAVYTEGLGNPYPIEGFPEKTELILMSDVVTQNGYSYVLLSEGNNTIPKYYKVPIDLMPENVTRGDKIRRSDVKKLFKV